MSCSINDFIHYTVHTLSLALCLYEDYAHWNIQLCSCGTSTYINRKQMYSDPPPQRTPPNQRSVQHGTCNTPYRSYAVTSEYFRFEVWLRQYLISKRTAPLCTNEHSERERRILYIFQLNCVSSSESWLSREFVNIDCLCIGIFFAFTLSLSLSVCTLR